jgi:hypothetical protein
MTEQSRIVTLYEHLKSLSESTRGAERATLNNVCAMIHRLMTMQEKSQVTNKKGN